MLSRFRRVSLCVTVGLACAALVWWLLIAGLPFLNVYAIGSTPDTQVPFGYALTAAALGGWGLLYLTARAREDETRCRKCGYILRGLSEPRCPECGERI
ncbi:MAG: hypothetical protein AB1716_08055 [Planctomycetota bacterium]